MTRITEADLYKVDMLKNKQKLCKHKTEDYQEIGTMILCGLCGAMVFEN